MAASHAHADALAVAAGDRLVVRRAITLPDVCVKCGAPAVARRERALWHAAPWTWALLVLGPFGALGMLALTKTAALAVPLCARCDARWNAAALARKAVTIVAIATTLVAVFWPLLAPGGGATIAAAVVTIVGLVAIAIAYAATRARFVRATQIDAERVTLAGVHGDAIGAACRDATPGVALTGRATTRLAARLLAAHLLAYTLGLAWAVAAIPIVVQALPKDLGDDAQAISALVLRKVLWPFVGVWIAVHLASLPWAFTKSAARLPWTRAIFLVAIALLFVGALVAGGVYWWKLFHL